MDKLAIQGGYKNETVGWVPETSAISSGPIPAQPALGVLLLHPTHEEIPARLIVRTRIPGDATSIHARLSSNANARAADFSFRWFLHDGDTHVLAKKVVSTRNSQGSWTTIGAGVASWAGKEVLLDLVFSAGGRHSWNHEHSFLDSITFTK